MTTVEQYLQSKVLRADLPDYAYENAANSPMEVGLKSLDLGEDAYPENAEDDFRKRLDYALSTVYYSLLGLFAGGGRTEQYGDVRMSQSNFVITKADRDRFKAEADALRRKHGFIVLDYTEGGMFDGGYLRRG